MGPQFFIQSFSKFRQTKQASRSFGHPLHPTHHPTHHPTPIHQEEIQKMEQQEPLIQLSLDQLQPLQEGISSPTQGESQTLNGTNNNDNKNRRPRSKWTTEETQDLIKGCNIHGVGNWKKYVIIMDSR
jgi:hypothetical protein